MDNSKFYDNLSPDYDQMIKFEQSLINKIEYLKNFIKEKDNRALDLGCGTGADSITLAKAGLEVDAVDHSPGMLKQAMRNADIFDIKINFLQSGLADFTNNGKKYDLIVSLGNTFANLNKDEMEITFRNFKGLINSHGRIVLQLINYAKLPTRGDFLLNTFDSESCSITRKYTIHKNNLEFIIDKINKLTNQKSQMVTKLYQHSQSVFTLFAEKNNLQIEFFGNLKKEPYINAESSNLVVLLSK